MNKQYIFTSLIAIFFLFLLSACESIKTYYNPDGSISAKIPIVDGEYNGTAFYYHPNGRVKLKLDFVNGEPNGEAIHYYLKGGVERIEHYNNGILNGETKAFNKNGNITSIVNYKSDTLDSDFEEYYPSGALKVRGTYKMGKYHGTWSYWSGEGEKIGEGNFVNGTGVQKKWYATRELLMEQEFLNNLRHGQEIWYNKDGSIIKKFTYKHGVTIKTEIFEN